MATISQLTGDVTGSGHGAVAATIASLAVTNAKIANATIDLTAKVTGQLPIANGGTGQSTAGNAFNALSPITTTGDMIYSASGATNSRLPIGSTGQILQVSGGVPVWSPNTATALMNGNVRGSEGGGTVTLTNSDNQTQTFNLSSAETVKLPTTGVAKGDIWEIINPNQQVLTIQSSGANNIIKSWGSRVVLQANIATPTAAADWTVLEHVVLQGRVWTDYTPTYSTGTGISTTFFARWIRTSINDVMIAINCRFNGSNSGGSGHFSFTGPSFLLYNNTDYPDGTDANLGGAKLAGSQSNNNSYIDLAAGGATDNTFFVYFNNNATTWALFPWNGFVNNDTFAAQFSFKSSTLSET